MFAIVRKDGRAVAVKLRSGRRRGQGRGVGVDAYSFGKGYF
jgi:hypothetical protein